MIKFNKVKLKSLAGMIKYYILFLFSLLIIACEKDKKNDNDTEEKEYPKTVTHSYGGVSVTYGVIKKDYYLDPRGDSLPKPITKLWLDRNLGAQRVATYIDDTLAAGDLFQWGRLADGHQYRNSQTIEQLSDSIIPGHDKFITKSLFSDDWLSNSNDSLWNDQENTNCSCPVGWRVPTKDELLMEMHSWTSTDMPGAYASELKWVPTGNRDNHGTERYSEYWGFIWSSTPTVNANSYTLAIIGTDTAEISSSPRIYGHAVRCIKDY